MSIEEHQKRITSEHAAIFNEWAKRYAANPSEFLDILDEQGKPIDDYGELCAAYFKKLHSELFPA